MIDFKALECVNKKLKTLDVKGKAYVQVNERVKAFREICPNGSITTELISLDNGVATMQATIKNEDGVILSTGLSQEKESSSYINKTSFIENAETSAVGRALGFLGIGIDASMASAEEVANAIINQNKKNKQETAEDSIRNKEMRENVKTEFLPTNDNTVTKEQLEKLNEEMIRTGITEQVIKSMFNVNSIQEMSQSQVIAALNKFSKTKDKS